MPNPEPIAVQVTRYRCPSCGRTEGNRSRARAHMSRCWLDPANRGCKTCAHFERWADEYGDACDKGVDLSGHPACSNCAGIGYVSDFAEGRCPACNDVPEVRDVLKPGPIIHCDQWQARDGEDARWR